MTALAQARKGKGIDEVISTLEPGKLEKMRDAAVSHNQRYDEALHKLVRILTDKGFHKPVHVRQGWDDPAEPEIAKYINDILHPDEINDVLQASIQYEEHPDYSMFLPFWLNRLIQNSYDAGHNDFKLLTSVLAEPLWHLGNKLKGTKERPIRISAGDLGDSLGFDAEFIECTALNVGYECGYNAQDCSFTLYGNPFYDLAWNAVRCTFNLYGRGIEWEKKDIEPNHPIVKCTFRSPHQNIVDILQKNVPPENRIILLNEAGKETIVRDYHEPRH